MNGINGIIYCGKVYKAVKCNAPCECKGCDLKDECGFTLSAKSVCFDILEPGYHFRFSQELTDKINEK